MRQDTHIILFCQRINLESFFSLFPIHFYKIREFYIYMIHRLAAAHGPGLVICIMVSFAFYAVKNVHHLYITPAYRI